MGEKTYTVRENIQKLLRLKTVFLKETVAQSLEGSKGDYAFSILNLQTGESHSLNEHKVFEAASLYKLWVLAAAYQQIQAGKLDLDEVITDEIPELNEEFHIASEEAELQDGEISMTVRDLLTQMITISHNYSALMLTKRLGSSTIIDFMKKTGFRESSFGESNGLPSTTAYDTQLFFKKLYNQELANGKYTAEMITLLKAQQLNEKIPKNLPNKVEVAHKTGELNYVSHDAGIVFMPGNNYILVALSESDYPPGAVERIARVSEAVYNYFKKEE